MDAAVNLKVVISVLEDSQNSIKTILKNFQALYAGIQGASGSKTPVSETTEQVEALKKSIDGALAKTHTLGDEGGEGPTKLRRPVDDASKGFEHLEGTIQKVRAALEYVGATVGLYFSLSFLKGILDTSARAEVLSTVLHVVGNNAGYASAYLDKLDRDVQKLGITASESRKSLVQLIQADLDPALAAGPHGLARAAQDLAVIAGLNSSETFGRLVTSIQRLDTESLRYLGVVVNQEQAQQRYAASVHRSVGELTTLEKTQALANEVLLKAAELAGTYENAMNDVGKMLTSLPRYTEQLRVATGEGLLPVYRELVSEFTLLLRNLTTIIEAQNAATGSTNGLAASVRAILDPLRLGLQEIVKYKDVVFDVVKVFVAWRAALAITSALSSLSTFLGYVKTQTIALIASATADIAAKNLQTKATLELAAAEKLQGTAALEAAAETATAATGITTLTASVSLLSLGLQKTLAFWGSLASTLAVPIIGYVILKRLFQNSGEDLSEKTPFEQRKTIENRGDSVFSFQGQNDQRRAFEQWKREHQAEITDLVKQEGTAFRGETYAVSDPKKYPALVGGSVWDLYAKSYDTYLAKTGKGGELEALETKRQAVTATKDKLEALKDQQSADAIATKQLLQARLLAEEEEVRLETDKVNKVTRIQSAANILVQRETEQSLAQAKIAEFGKQLPSDKRPESEKLLEAKILKDQYDDASKAVTEAQNKFNDVKNRDKVGPIQEQAAKEQAQLNEIRRKERLTTQAIADARRIVNADVYVSQEGVTTTKKFTDDLGNWRQLFTTLNVESKDFVKNLDESRHGLINVGNTVQRTEDLTLFRKNAEEYRQTLKNTGALTAKDNADINEALARATFNSSRFVLAQTSDLDNELKALDKGKIDRLLKATELEIALLHNSLQLQEELELSFYGRGELSFAKYHDGRMERLKLSNAGELKLAREHLAALERQLSIEKVPLARSNIATEIVAAKAKIVEQQGTAEAKEDLQKQVTVLQDAAAKKTGTPAQRREITRQITEKQADIATIEAQVTRAGGKEQPGTDALALQREKDKATADELAIRDQITQIENKTAAYYGGELQTEKQIIDTYRIKERQLKQSEEGHRAINAAIAQEVFATNLQRDTQGLAAYVAQEKARLDYAEANIEVEKKAGTLTTTEAQRASTGIQERRIELLRAEITFEAQVIQRTRERIEQIKAETKAKLEAKFDADGKPYDLAEVSREAEGSVDRLNTILERSVAHTLELQTAVANTISSISSYGKDLQHVFTDGLGGAIEDSLKGLLTFRKQVIGSTQTIWGAIGSQIGFAFAKMGEALRDNVFHVVGAELSDRFTKSLLKITTDSKGTIFDKVFNFLGLGKTPTAARDGSLEKFFWIKDIDSGKAPKATVTAQETLKLPEKFGGQAIIPDLGPVSPDQFGTGTEKQPLGFDIEGNFTNDATRLYQDLDGTILSTKNAQGELFKTFTESIAKISLSQAVTGARIGGGHLGLIAPLAKLVVAFSKFFGHGLGPNLFGGPSTVTGNFLGDEDFNTGGFAKGGIAGVIQGPGTGTSDSITAKVSSGEHIMPAEKTKTWLPLLEAIRTGKAPDSLMHKLKFAMGGVVNTFHNLSQVMTPGMPGMVPAFAMGGLVGEVQSIAVPQIIAPQFAGGGVVNTDAGAAQVQPGGQSGPILVSLHPDHLNFTMREWLEHEVARQQALR